MDRDASRLSSEAVAPDYWLWKAAAAGLWLATITAIAIAINQRGIWYDELYTLYVTRPPLALGYALQEYWLNDNHPPLYYFLSWSTNFLGDDFIARRYLNLAIFVAASFGFLAVARARLVPLATIVLFAASLVALGDFFGNASQLRSYFLSLAIVALLSLLLTALASAPAWRTRIGLVLLTGLAALIGANTHFITTLMAGSLIGGFALRYFLERKFGRAWLTVAIGIAASLPFLVNLAIALETLEAHSQTFWIEPGLRTGGMTALNFGLGVLADILPVTLTGIAGLLLLLRDTVRARAMDARLKDVVTLAASLLIFLVLLLAVHAWRPVIADYYLISIVGPICLCLAIGTSRTLDALRASFARLLLASLLILFAANLYDDLRRSATGPSLREAALFIKARIDECDGTIVHADTFPQSYLIGMPPKENGIVTLGAYAKVSRIYGFSVEPASSRAVSDNCPTLFWTAHHWAAETTYETLKRLRAEGYPIARLERHELGRGIVNIVHAVR